MELAEAVPFAGTNLEVMTTGNVIRITAFPTNITERDVRLGILPTQCLNLN